MKRFQNPPAKYRPVPFWSWNERLDTEETRRQVRLMHEAGMGGYFMHARGGLQTPYMGEEWFANVTAAAEEGASLGMESWAYDENGWPSGFGDGRVNGRGVAYQQKYLRWEEGDRTCDTTITHTGGYHFYYDINPFYVDTLDSKVIRTFIEEIYEPYYQKYGNKITGFFTDEPQISRNGIPWSFCLEEAYRERYGEELLPLLPELFFGVGRYEETRVRFWQTVTDLFTNAFNKQIFEWCEERGLSYTGHMVCEDTLQDQLTSNGAVMPHYEWMHMPGVDLLGRYNGTKLLPLQVSSVAHQTGKKQVLTESFALCGHNVSFDELRGLLEFQMVRGVTRLCQHLEGYTLRGIRKRDYPPAFNYQQPWWQEYRTFNDAMSRIGMLLSEGEAAFDTLLIHPQTTAWMCFDNKENKGLQEVQDAFNAEIDLLERKHIPFDLGDETLLERMAYVEGGALVVGKQRYHTVVLPKKLRPLENTKKLLCELKAQGGRVLEGAESLPDNEVTDNPDITYTTRSFGDFDLHYFVNSGAEEQKARITCGSAVFDLLTGEVLPFDGVHTFPPRSSLAVIDRHDGAVAVLHREEPKPKHLPISGEWEVTACEENALALNFCDYYFDGVLEEENGHVLNIGNRANELRRPVDIRMVYRVQTAFVPEKTWLVCETPENFKIFVNGEALIQKDEGYFCDSSFRKLPITLQKGDNEIVFETRFAQSETVYENMEKAKVFESEKNKLTYDQEIEGIFIVGDFDVKTDGSFTSLDRDAVRYHGSFCLCEKAKAVEPTHLEQQGYPYFSGRITLAKTFVLEDTDYCLSFKGYGVNAVHVKVNGEELGVKIFRPFSFDLRPYLQKGENRIELTLVNNLRNLLGPHYQEIGENYNVAPGSFFKEPCIWNDYQPPEKGWGGSRWVDDPCFVIFGIEEA